MTLQPNNNNNNVQLETRIILLERDVELLKLRDSDIRVWQDGVNRALYKMEVLEKALDETRERLDENMDVMKGNSHVKYLESVLIAKMDELKESTSNKSEKPPEKSTWDKNLEKTIQVIFIIVLLIAGILGIKIPSSIGGG